MAKIKTGIVDGRGVNFKILRSFQLDDYKEQTHNSKAAIFFNDDSNYVMFFGPDMIFSLKANGDIADIVDGTMRYFSIVRDGQQIASFSGLDLNARHIFNCFESGNFSAVLNGDDSIFGTGLADTLLGENGEDTLRGAGGNDVLAGGLGMDELHGGEGNDELDGGAGRDVLRGNGGDDSLFGRDDDDHLNGDSGDDVLNGGGGFDRLLGGRGDDTLNGGAKSDQLFGGGGSDTLVGGRGGDTLDGKDGDDKLYGSGGKDRLEGGADDDALYGGNGKDGLEGGGGDDLLSGGEGADILKGEENDDTLYGENGADKLDGDEGDDVIHGDRGNDRLSGDTGSDRLDGGQGGDLLRGGWASDVFVISGPGESGLASPTRDRIVDFSQEQQDRIDLSDFDAAVRVAGMQSFTFIGDAAFTGAGAELRYVHRDDDTYVYGDINRGQSGSGGDRIADFSILLDGTHTLTASDFIL